jgi:hypothetical protein
MRPRTLTALAAVGLAVAAPGGVGVEPSPHTITSITIPGVPAAGGIGAVKCTLVKRAAACNGIKAVGANLAGRNLRGRHFDRGNFSGASFRGADLRGATFRGANLSGADFSGAILDRADQLALCRQARGRHPGTGVETRLSLGC